MQELQRPKQGYKFVTLRPRYVKLEIPDNWNFSSIEKICKTSSGGTPSRNNPKFFNGNIPWIKTGELNDGYLDKTEEHISESALSLSSAKKFPPKTVLIAMYGATIGKTCITTMESTTNQACCALIPIQQNLIEPYFLQQYLILIRPLMISLGEGAGQPNTSQDFIRAFQIVYPCYTEQLKISLILSSVDSLIQKTDEVIVQTQRLKKGLMQRLLTKGIGHTKFKKTPIGEIPTEWEIVSLQNICEIKGRVGWKGYSKTDLVQKPYGVISLGVSNITTDNKLNMEDITCVTWKKYEESPEIEVTKGDIIITQRGSTIGKVAIIDQDIGKATINPNVVLLKKIKINNFYVYHFLDSSLFEKQIFGLISSTSIPLLTQQQIRSIKFPYPQILEQQKIVDILSSLSTYIQTHQDQKSYLENLKKGLMQKLLTGQIRVKI